MVYLAFETWARDIYQENIAKQSVLFHPNMLEAHMASVMVQVPDAHQIYVHMNIATPVQGCVLW